MVSPEMAGKLVESPKYDPTLDARALVQRTTLAQDHPPEAEDAAVLARVSSVIRVADASSGPHAGRERNRPRRAG
jgi:hypothetical protein